MREDTESMTEPSVSIVRPRGAVQAAYTGREVAQAYNMIPAGVTGKGAKIGYIELGGGIDPTRCGATSQPRPGLRHRGGITGSSCWSTAPGRTPDGPNGADGEVLLDVEVGASVAPGCQHRVYFAPNTDSGLPGRDHARGRRVRHRQHLLGWPGDAVVGQLRSSSSPRPSSSQLREQGVKVFVASGDTGSRDGSRVATVDYPASDPNVIACGGTQLHGRPADWQRISEVAWDDDDRAAPRVAGCPRSSPAARCPTSPGTPRPPPGTRSWWTARSSRSAAPPRWPRCTRASPRWCTRPPTALAYDFLNTVVTNPQACYDVTLGDNGDYRAGPGRDQVTGFGVVDGAKFLAALTSGIPAPVPPSPVAPSSSVITFTPEEYFALDGWAKAKLYSGTAAAKRAWKRATAR
jgi:kumamolisin